MTNHKSFLLTKLHQMLKFEKTPRVKLQIARIKTLIKNTRNKILSNIQEKTEKHWEKTLNKIDHTQPEKFFPIINKIFRPKSLAEPPTLIISKDEAQTYKNSRVEVAKYTSLDNNLHISETKDKINIMGAYFECINAPKNLNAKTRLREIIDTEINLDKATFDARQNKTITIFSDDNKAVWPIHTTTGTKYFCNTPEVSAILKKLPNKTSTGHDKIPTIVLKHLPPEYIKNYTILFNNALNLQYFPKEWKKAKIIPIYKKGKDPKRPSSYRPISLTPNISKVYEAIINNRIIEQCNSHKIIPNNQYGFRAKHSTIHAINRLTSDICNYLNQNQIVGATLLDLEKAFDSVWINGLIHTLKRKKFSQNIINTIWDMITERSFQVNIGKETSNTYQIKEGLPQGMVNSPYLFNIFTADIINGYNLNTGNNTHSIAFADDVIIYTAGETPEAIHNKLNPLVNNIYNTYNSWNLKVNPDKSETIIFTRPLRFISKNKRAKNSEFAITIKTGQDNSITHIPTKNEVKYLGVTIDKLAKFNTHVETQLNKAIKAFRALHYLFYNKHLTPKAKTICYLLLIRPLITYAAPIWWNISANQIEKLRTFERSCLRSIYKMYKTPESEYTKNFNNRQLYNMAKIPRIDNFLIKITRNHFAQIINNKNEDIRKIATTLPPNLTQSLEKGLCPPQCFTFIDSLGLIQDGNNIPTIYHRARHKSDKAIPIKEWPNKPLKYSRAMADRDKKDAHRLNKKYWWLNEKQPVIKELKSRISKEHSKKTNRQANTDS